MTLFRDVCAKACLALWASVGFTACAPGDDTSSSAADPVKAIVLPFLSMAPFYIAAEEGYFAEQNLDVEFVRMSRNVDAIAALARGDVDVGAGQLAMNVLNTIAGGERIRLVADAAHLDPEGCTFNAAVARRELAEVSKLDVAEQLRGRRFELDIALPQGYWVSRMLAPLGLTIGDVQVENVPPPAAMEALLHGTLDLAVISEPYLSQLLETGEVVVWRRTEQAVPGFQLSAVMFGPNLLDERPEVGQRFLVAFLQAVRQLKRGKTSRNLDILERATGLSRAQLNAACWPSYRDDGQVTVEGLSAYQKWAMSQELVDRVLPEEKLVDRRFVEQANAVLRSAPEP